jgi:hypothetical protein
MDNVQKLNYCTNVPSSQIVRSFYVDRSLQCRILVVLTTDCATAFAVIVSSVGDRWVVRSGKLCRYRYDLRL